MPTISEVLSTKKQAPLARLESTDTVRKALELMAEREIGSVLIMQGEALLGIFTERDYARRIILHGLSSVDSLLADVMTSKLYTVSPRQTVQDCLGLMTKGRVRHLPVVDAGEVVGLVSIGDLVNATLEEQRFLIEQMENYIAGHMG